MLESDEDRIVQTPTQARAGVTGHHVRHVLLFSTVGVIIVLAAVYLFYFT